MSAGHKRYPSGFQTVQGNQCCYGNYSLLFSTVTFQIDLNRKFDRLVKLFRLGILLNHSATVVFYWDILIKINTKTVMEMENVHVTVRLGLKNLLEIFS